MKKTTYGIIITLVLIFVTGCSESDIKDAIDKAKGDDKATTTSTSAKTWATVKYSDGSTMGITRPEEPVNGGFQIYHVGTAQVVGFIGADTVVNDIGGSNLGVCVGATVSDNGVSGDCTVPVSNPSLVPVQPILQPISQPTSSPVVITDPNCPDTRNGDFNPSYSPAVCNANGYFWCSITQACLDKPINVPECGEIWERS